MTARHRFNADQIVVTADMTNGLVLKPAGFVKFVSKLSEKIHHNGGEIMDKEKWKKRQLQLATEEKNKRKNFLKKQAELKKKQEQHEIERTTGQAPQPGKRVKFGPSAPTMSPEQIQEMNKQAKEKAMKSA